MADRRQFIKSGLALSAMCSSVLSAMPAGVGAAEVATLRLERFVFDNRFEEAREAAQQAAQQGIPLAEVSGDLTDLWYDDLDLQWKKASMALAGITNRSGLFVLETLAADFSMRVVYRGIHAVPKNGRVAHTLKGPASLIERAKSAADKQRWALQLGSALTRCPFGKPSAAKLELSTPAVSASAREEPIYSWIIAPRSSVALTV